MSPNSHGLSYHFRKFQIPAGIQAFGYIGNYLSIGLIAEIRPDFYSRVRVAGSTFKLHKARSYRASAPFTFYLNPPSHFSLQVTPFYDWNRFGSTPQKRPLWV